MAQVRHKQRPAIRIVCLLAWLGIGGLCGCASLPTAGPTTSQVLDQAKAQQTHFDIVGIDPHVVMAMSARPADSLRSHFDQDGKTGAARIGVGDTVAISIWETAAEGAVGATTPKESTVHAPNVTIPDQVVGTDGGVSVPFAGRIAAAGRTPVQVQTAIEHALADRAIEPQAIVTVAKNVSGMVTVSGETVSGMRVPLSVRGDRLLDVIAAAGGTKSAPYETSVRLTRDGTTVTISMQKLVTDPAENIYARPGDVITLLREPQTFLVFGATTNNSQLPFNADHLNLAQAIARAGGLLDLRADPSGVFLFRFEPPAVVRELGVADLGNAPGGTTPVLYHLDLHEVASYFLASRFPMQDGDIIYVSNAPFTELQKFMTVIGSLTSPVLSVAPAPRP